MQAGHEEAMRQKLPVAPPQKERKSAFEAPLQRIYVRVYSVPHRGSKDRRPSLLRGVAYCCPSTFGLSAPRPCLPSCATPPPTSGPTGLRTPTAYDEVGHEARFDAEHIH